jgi:hypothetical protein
MNENARLKCQIMGESDLGWYKLQSWLEDETPFNIEAPKHMVRVIEGSKPQAGWLQVEYNGESNQRASITLPYPDMRFGNKMTVSTKYIDR